MSGCRTVEDWHDYEPVCQQLAAEGVPVARDDAECAALDHPPATANAVSWVGGRTFCRCGLVSQPGMHGGASDLGYHLPDPVSARTWVFGADRHLDWPVIS